MTKEINIDYLIAFKHQLDKMLAEHSYGERLALSSTNSPVGSSHWFVTLLANIKHIGEYMINEDLTEKQRKDWGKCIVDNTKELLDNFNKIPCNY